MSYVRIGEDGSDVYVYLSAAGLICCGNACSNVTEMVNHLRWHQELGDHVPEWVIEDVEANPELDPAKAGPHSGMTFRRIR